MVRALRTARGGLPVADQRDPDPRLGTGHRRRRPQAAGGALRPDAPVGLRALDVVETLRITWIQQLHCQDDTVTWRTADDLPPPSVRLDSPYDREAHCGNKRSATWTGYKVHLTETYDDGLPYLIVHVVDAVGYQFNPEEVLRASFQ